MNRDRLDLFMNFMLGALFVTQGVQAGCLRDKRPNVLLIVADDMGFSDIGCYGNPVIKTPVLDRLAEKGVRFSQFYNGARSCPARASLLTGLYAHQTGMGHMMADLGQDGYCGDLNDHCVTIAEVLKQGGYATYMSGKWHVTRHYNSDSPKDNWPLQRGFDYFYGTIVGGGNYFDPASLCRQNEYISPFDDPAYRTDNYYYTNAIGDNAVRFMEKHAEEKSNTPFFLYMAFTAPHFPMQAPDDLIDEYKGQFDQGWDALREEKFKKLKELGIIPAFLQDAGRDPSVNAWVDEKHKNWEQRLMEVYAAMVTCMDKNIGKVIEMIRKQGELENTLILFLSDNGGCAEGYGRKPNFPQTIKLPQGEDYKPLSANAVTMDAWGRMFAGWPFKNREGTPVWEGKDQPAGGDTTFIAYGMKWANCSNTPFRLYKHWVHEGGISTPLIISWPAQIHKRGQIIHQPGQLTDIMATILDATHAEYPLKRKGVNICPPEGISLLPAVCKGIYTERTLFWEHEGNCAIRQGNWKLVRTSAFGWGNKQPLGGWELYNLQEDRTELKNLAEQYPLKVKDMAEIWERWALRCHVKPFPNKNR